MLEIVFGFKVLFKVLDRGTFACPNCGRQREFERREARKWFMLFFVPVVPMKTISRVIRCTTCGNDFRESVLAPSAVPQFLDLVQNAVRAVMVNVLRQGGALNPAARYAAVQEIVLSGAAGYQDANLDQDLPAVPQDLSTMLGSLTAQLPQSGREALVAGAARVALADGPLNPGEQAVLGAVGAALGMSAVYVAGIVGSVGPGQGGYAAAGRPQ